MVVESSLPGIGPSVAQQRHGGQRNERRARRSSELRISGRRPRPDSAAPSFEDADGVAAVLVRAAQQVPVLDPLLVRHQGLGPVDGAGADAEQGQEEPDAEAARSTEPRPGDSVHERHRGVELDREVGDQRSTVPSALMANRVATCRSARLAAFGSMSAIRWPVRPQAGVLEPLRQRGAAVGRDDLAAGAAVLRRRGVAAHDLLLLVGVGGTDRVRASGTAS